MYIVIAGCGRLGAYLATRLSKEGNDVAIVDRNADNFARLSDDFDGATVAGVEFDIAVLKSAGIEHADGFAAVSNADNINIMAAEVAKTIFNVPMIVARVFDPIKGETYRALGLETVCPTTSAADIIYSKFMVRREDAHLILPGGGVELMEVTIHGNAPAATVSTIEALDDFKIISRTRGTATDFPRAQDTVIDGDRLLVATHVQDVSKVAAIFHLDREVR